MNLKVVMNVEKKWDDLTEEEREEYINQDYVYRNFIMADPDTFSTKCNLASMCENAFISETALTTPIFSISDILTPKQLEVIKYFYIDHMSKSKIARKLNISVPAVFYRIERARNRLKSIFYK